MDFVVVVDAVTDPAGIFRIVVQVGSRAGIRSANALVGGNYGQMFVVTDDIAEELLGRVHSRRRTRKEFVVASEPLGDPQALAEATLV